MVRGLYALGQASHSQLRGPCIMQGVKVEQVKRREAEVVKVVKVEPVFLDLDP